MNAYVYKLEYSQGHPTKATMINATKKYIVDFCENSKKWICSQDEYLAIKDFIKREKEE